MLARTFAPLLVPLSVALVAPTLGCGGTAASAPAAADSSAARAPVAQNAHGPVKLIGEALADVPLTAAQRAEVETLAADAEARHASVEAARRDLMLAVAAQVEAGAIDRAALRPKVDAVAAAVAAAQPADRAAFERLHALLGPDQRTAFVDALEARVHEHMAGRWREHPMKGWAAELKLTDDQRARLKGLLEAGRGGGAAFAGGPWHEEMGHGAKVLRAFRQDRFVMDEVAPAVDAARRASEMSDRFLGFAEQALPILTAEQRSIAARTIRERAAAAGAPAAP